MSNKHKLAFILIEIGIFGAIFVISPLASSNSELSVRELNNEISYIQTDEILAESLPAESLSVTQWVNVRKESNNSFSTIIDRDEQGNCIIAHHIIRNEYYEDLPQPAYYLIQDCSQHLQQENYRRDRRPSKGGIEFSDT